MQKTIFSKTFSKIKLFLEHTNGPIQIVFGEINGFFAYIECIVQYCETSYGTYGKWNVPFAFTIYIICIRILLLRHIRGKMNFRQKRVNMHMEATNRFRLCYENSRVESKLKNFVCTFIAIIKQACGGCQTDDQCTFCGVDPCFTIHGRRCNLLIRKIGA